MSKEGNPNTGCWLCFLGLFVVLWVVPVVLFLVLSNV